MSDLVSRWSETLDEAERLAKEAAEHAGGPSWFSTEGADGDVSEAGRAGKIACGPWGGLWEIGPHMARWDPQAVLRLVAAHRKIIEAFTQAQEHAATLLRTRAHGATVLEADGVAGGLLIALENLADGWGLKDEEG